MSQCRSACLIEIPEHQRKTQAVTSGAHHACGVAATLCTNATTRAVRRTRQAVDGIEGRPSPYGQANACRPCAYMASARLTTHTFRRGGTTHGPCPLAASGSEPPRQSWRVAHWGGPLPPGGSRGDERTLAKLALAGRIPWKRPSSRSC